MVDVAVGSSLSMAEVRESTGADSEVSEGMDRPSGGVMVTVCILSD